MGLCMLNLLNRNQLHTAWSANNMLLADKSTTPLPFTPLRPIWRTYWPSSPNSALASLIFRVWPDFTPSCRFRRAPSTRLAGPTPWVWTGPSQGRVYLVSEGFIANRLQLVWERLANTKSLPMQSSISAYSLILRVTSTKSFRLGECLFARYKRKPNCRTSCSLTCKEAAPPRPCTLPVDRMLTYAVWIAC